MYFFFFSDTQEFDFSYLILQYFILGKTYTCIKYRIKMKTKIKQRKSKPNSSHHLRFNPTN